MQTTSLLLAGLVAAGATASFLPGQQSIVSPNQNTTVEGTSSNGYPVLTNLSPRYMAVHSDVGGSPKLIKQIGFRRNGGSASQSGTRTLDIEIRLGNSRDHDKVSYVFADNWLGTPTTVVPRQMVNIGPCNAPPSSPEPFEALFPLVMPFIYTGTTSLAYELVMYSNVTNGLTVTHDAETALATAGPAPVTTGPGCIPAGNSQPMNLVFSHRDTAGAYEFGGYLERGPVNAPTLIALGTSNPNLSVPGLCGNVLTDLLIILPVGLTDALGHIGEYGTTTTINYPSALFTFVLPNSLSGATIYAQAHTIDVARTDPIPVCNSNGVSFLVPPAGTGIPVKSTRLYTFNLQGPTYPNATPLGGGNVGWSVVTEFVY